MAIVYHHTHIDKLAKEHGGEESNALLTLSLLYYNNAALRQP